MSSPTSSLSLSRTNADVSQSAASSSSALTRVPPLSSKRTAGLLNDQKTSSSQTSDKIMSAVTNTVGLTGCQISEGKIPCRRIPVHLPSMSRTTGVADGESKLSSTQTNSSLPTFHSSSSSQRMDAEINSVSASWLNNSSDRQQIPEVKTLRAPARLEPLIFHGSVAGMTINKVGKGGVPTLSPLSTSGSSSSSTSNEMAGPPPDNLWPSGWTRVPQQLPIRDGRVPARLAPVVVRKHPAKKKDEGLSIFQQLPKVIHGIILQYLRRSLGELDDIRGFIHYYPTDGYQWLAGWLANRILVGPKGYIRTHLLYQKVILDSITGDEISKLKECFEIRSKLSLQNTFKDFSLRVSEQLLKSNTDQAYECMAKLIGMREPRVDLTGETCEISNSVAGWEELEQILTDQNVLDKVAARADSIANLGLTNRFAARLLERAQVLDSEKGLSLLCRSLADGAIVYRGIFPFSYVPLVAEGFVRHLKNPSCPPMTMVLNSPLWKPIHTHLQKYYRKDSSYLPNTLDPAMEWFIAGINLATKVQNDRLPDWEKAGFDWARNLKKDGYSLVKGLHEENYSLIRELEEAGCIQIKDWRSYKLVTKLETSGYSLVKNFEKMDHPELDKMAVAELKQQSNKLLEDLENKGFIWAGGLKKRGYSLLRGFKKTRAGLVKGFEPDGSLLRNLQITGVDIVSDSYYLVKEYEEHGFTLVKDFAGYNLIKDLEKGGYSLADLTPEVRNKITCLALDREACDAIHNMRDFIDTFPQLQTLRLKNPFMLELPSNCKNLIRLTLVAEKLNRLPQDMPNLEYLSLESSKAEWPKSLPKLETFVCKNSRHTLLPEMPRLRILDIDNTPINTWPNSPLLERFLVTNNNNFQELTLGSNLQVFILRNCLALHKLHTRLASNDTWLDLGDPETQRNLDILPRTLHNFQIINVGNPHIQEYCRLWNLNWMDGAMHTQTVSPTSSSSVSPTSSSSTTSYRDRVS